ncbi:MAG: hypothetical protein KJN71_07680 [Acidimicrobiia bacterium]|nr:hypothetical protein [Acidimicrobiia bacterium]NNC75005.1 hypothetical protein [Acidimicrobiia bacterium]
MIDDAPGVSDELVEAAEAIAAAPAQITPEWIGDLVHRGLDLLAYVEVTGIVSRLIAGDTYLRGVGADVHPLSEPVEGDPSGERMTEAGIDRGWVPTVGPAGAPNALSAVPAENVAQEDLHSALYLSYEGMADLDATIDGLHRTQMELTAARTSFINDCFF